MAERTIRKPKPPLHLRVLQHPLVSRHFPLIQEELTATCSRRLIGAWLGPA